VIADVAVKTSSTALTDLAPRRRMNNYEGNSES
jgi:hypothetical protein